jgi:Transposase DDE domain
MELAALPDDDWEYVQTLLPGDLEESAYRSGALLRCRNIPDAASFMRIVLAYAVSDLSLKDVAAWASALRLAQITGPGLFYRLRQAGQWLEQVLGRVLSDQVPHAAGGLRLRVVDATVLNGPGQKAVPWRAHVSIDPSTGSIRAVELTDDSGGEKFSRHHFRAHEVVLGDRGYATARGLYAVGQQEAHAVARFHPATLRTCDEKRCRLYLAEKEPEVPKVGAVEFAIKIPVPPPPTGSHKTWDSAKAIAWIPARAIAARTRTGEVTWIVTTLAPQQMLAVGICGLYRVRWQIELLFKRLKSLLHLDTLPSREGPTAKSWMLARLIAAALAQRLVPPSGPLSPWGYELRRDSTRPSEGKKSAYA